MVPTIFKSLVRRSRLQNPFLSCNLRFTPSKDRLCNFSSFNNLLKPPNLELSTQYRSITLSSCLLKIPRVTITFVKKGGSKFKGTAKVGASILDLVQENELDISGFGACGGTLSCSTCHVRLLGNGWENLPNPLEDELDMLQFAPGITDNSRLGCQVMLTEEMDGLEVEVPEIIQDMRGDKD